MPRWICALLAILVVGCGSDDERSPVVVSAASSLRTALTGYADARYSFAGSDELAAQIRQGVAPDVFAAANTALPEALHAEGLVEEPVAFASNRLVLAVPAGSPVRSLDDLAQPGVKLAIGSASVPIGAYTRDVLDRLPGAQGDRVLANVRSNEPDVAGVVGKLTQGAADAGFVYVTDVAAADGALEAIDLPEALQPRVTYGVAVVKGADHPEEARQFVDGLLGGAGREALRAAGFEPPPGQ
jgi:molybdate transport system substrate-binding protein